MIARIWHETVPFEKSESFCKCFRETGRKEYERTPGNKGVLLLKKCEDKLTHFITLTFWKDLAAIEKFAALNVEKAGYFKRNKSNPTPVKPYVSHYEIVEPLYKNLTDEAGDSSFQKTFLERPILFYR